MKKIGNKQALLDSLVELVVQPIREDEFVIEDYMQQAGIKRTTAFRILQSEIKKKKIKCRIAMLGGRRVKAYSSI